MQIWHWENLEPNFVKWQSKVLWQKWRKIWRRCMCTKTWIVQHWDLHINMLCICIPTQSISTQRTPIRLLLLLTHEKIVHFYKHSSLYCFNPFWKVKHFFKPFWSISYYNIYSYYSNPSRAETIGISSIYYSCFVWRVHFASIDILTTPKIHSQNACLIWSVKSCPGSTN